VIFCWIPGHVSIKGNIEADKLARDTLSSHKIYPFPIQTFFLLREVSSFPSGKPFGTLILMTNTIKYFLNSSTSHPYTKIRLSSSVTLLLLTHTFLIKNNPLCVSIVNVSWTAEHILTTCTVYKQVREKYYQHSQLSRIFINAPKQYNFNFLNEIKL